MPAQQEWTLTEAATILHQRQHRLIHLCVKGVVVPDIEDARGRGSSRRFSARNLLEFAVALKLRDLLIPVAPIGVILSVLRRFEGSVANKIPDFSLPKSLQATSAPELRIIVADGQKLYFALKSGRGEPKLYGGVDLKTLGLSKGRRSKASSSLGVTPYSSNGSIQGRGFVEVSVTGLARDLAAEIG